MERPGCPTAKNALQVSKAGVEIGPVSVFSLFGLLEGS